MASNRILDFYRKILKTAGLSVDENGHIVLVEDDKKTPITVGKKPLVLPTEDNLNAFENDGKGRLKPKYHFFHPLKESDLHPESAVLKKLKDCIAARLNITAYTIGLTILSLMVRDPKNPMVAEIYTKIAKDKRHTPDEKTIEAFDKIVANYMKKSVNKALVGFYVKRGGRIGNTNYRRIVTIWYPIYEDLEKLDGDREIAGIKLRKKDIAILKGLMRILFPYIDHEEENYIGSNSKIAPALDALLRAAEKAGRGLIALAKVLKIDFEDVGGLISFDYMDDLDDIESHQKEIEKLLVLDDKTPPEKREPSDGSTKTEQKDSEVKRGKLDPRELFKQQVNKDMTQQTHPTVRHTSRGLDPRSLVQTIPGPQPIPPAPPQMHPPYPMGFQQPQPMPMGYPQQPPVSYQQPMPYRPMSVDDDRDM